MSAPANAHGSVARGDRERVARVIRAHEDQLRALGVERLWLFGSVARGEAGPDSDIDIMVSVPPAGEFSLLDLAEVHAEISHLVGRATDVMIREDAEPQIWETIRDDLIEVF